MVEHAVIQVLALLLIATMVGMGARRLRLPYTLALVLTGMGIGLFDVTSLQGIHLTPDLLLAIFLPALLFEAAYHLDFRRFRVSAGPVLLLAVVGVLLAVAVTGVASWVLLGWVGAPLSLGDSLLLGAMIAATDPISVLALFRSLGVDKRLYVLVEGESLLNDGVAVVVFVIMAAVLGIHTGHGEAPHLEGLAQVAVYGVRTFAWMAGVGVGIGGLLGLVVSVLTRQVDDRLLEVSLSFVLAYGSFLLAEQAHASGVLSCVSAGVVLGSFGSRFGMSAPTRMAVVDFWEFMAFFANSFVFLLVGIELDIPELVGHMGLVVLVFVAVLLGRAAAVYGLLPMWKRLGGMPVSSRWRHVLFWGGLRGSLSMMLVVGLPPDMPARRLLLLLVFGVVSLSLFLQGLTMKPLLARLGMIGTRRAQLDYERARGGALMARAALTELGRQVHTGAVTEPVRVRLESWYESRRAEDETRAGRLAGEAHGIERLQEAALHLLHAEEDALHHATAEGVISDEVARQLLGELANRRLQLHHGDEEPDALPGVIDQLFGPDV